MATGSERTGRPAAQAPILSAMKAKDLLKPVDPLGEALHFLRMSGSLYCCSELTAPWAIDMPVFEDCLMFHAVISGPCGLAVPGLPARLLPPGELVLLPPGEGHTPYSDRGVPAARLFDLPRQALSDRHEILRHGGAATHAVSGLVRFEHPAAYRLVSLLPRLLCLDADDAEQVAWRLHTLRLMATAAAALRPGGEMLITRLAELAGRHGYQSEAAFSRAFKRVVGVSPGQARRGYVSTASTLLPSGSMMKAA